MSKRLNLWDAEALQARICDAKERTRHPGGSPDEQEISAYAAALPADTDGRAAVVLGMTPELRQLATRHFKKTYAVDASTLSIQTYKDWVDEESRSRETIVHDRWLSLSRHITDGAAAILGDGVFGNLPDIRGHRQLLTAVRSSLHPGGRFITRKALIPKGFVSSGSDMLALLQQYRRGELDDAEFGFGVRLLGHYSCCYDPQTYILDNAKLFAECEKMWRGNELTDTEYACIRRYYFAGRNCVVTQELWERLLEDAGFSFRVRRCHGKHWYDYYLVYEIYVDDDQKDQSMMKN